MPDAADPYDVSYRDGCVSMARRRDGVAALVETCVAADGDVELRALTLRNDSARPRRIELTTCAEVVLHDPAAHAAHPAFSKLFVQTEYAASHELLLASRRPRAAGEPRPWMFHSLLGEGALQVETDRARFLGRGRSARRPLALTSGAALSGTAGSVLDPVFSLRRVASLRPGESARLVALLGAAPARAAAVALHRRFSAPGAVEAAFRRAAEAERERRARLGLGEAEAARLQDLVVAMLYGHPDLRAAPDVLARCRGSERDLARHGLRAGVPFAAARLAAPGESRLLADLVRAFAYWTAMGFRCDALLLAGEPDSVRAAVRSLFAKLGVADAGDDPARGRLLVRHPSEIPAPDLDFVLASARLVVGAAAAPREATAAPAGLPDATDLLTVSRHAEVQVPDPDGDSGSAPREAGAAAAARSAEELLFDNSYGGFSRDGREYVIRLRPGAPPPPMPWCNVVATEQFGFLASESGAGYTWSRNSRQNRLTPWWNDPVADPHGEALYVRDEESGAFWSPLPGPAPDGEPYECRHGFGYTEWRHTSRDLEQTVRLFVPRRDPVKIARLRLENRAARPRAVSVFSYHQLVLGVLPAESSRSVATEWRPSSRALLARNRASDEFADGIVFAAAVAPPGSGAFRFTADRAAFLGRNGSPRAPAALRGSPDLDGRTGAGLDPCAALQLKLSIPAGGFVDCAFLLGEVTAEDGAARIAEAYRRPGAIEAAERECRAFWTETLSAVRVGTPAPEIDLVTNGWLVYQALSCRLWGRSALYQSGGAFGFRDQLQDAAALLYSRPDMTRAQILLHAGRQFAEGDVLHWWHPPSGRGIRTRFSDDLLWLPFVADLYCRTTGDWGVLDDRADFLAARALEPGEDEACLLAAPSGESADLYEHCCRALDRSLARGAHGLPLMGSGDWNDGMNRVGREGRGESVWLGFFLHDVLGRFAPVCERRGDADRARRYRAHRAALGEALNGAGWDGAWYRRAYYDDGTPLGSAQNDECRIDALAQAWAVLSRAAPPERAARAMDAVESQLVLEEPGMIKLLAPPFDVTAHDPGYIKGYVPGIRENGGQYTHAALWVIRALAELGRRERAAHLLAELSPVHHARTAAEVAVYQVEPYVVAADVYGARPHVGRGGWTWYTGSAASMYRVALESVLGFAIEGGDTLILRPRIPDHWPGFAIRYRPPGRAGALEISVDNPARRAGVVVSALLDGRPVDIRDGAARLPLPRDGALHRVSVTLGEGRGW